MWDVMTKFTLAYFFKVQSWKQALPAGTGLSALDALVLVSQALSYVALWVSMTAVENSYKGIKFLCLVCSLQMLIHLVGSVSQHVILILNQDKTSDNGQDPTEACTFGTDEYVASRILSFGAFIAARLTCFQFFGFKRKNPVRTQTRAPHQCQSVPVIFPSRSIDTEHYQDKPGSILNLSPFLPHSISPTAKTRRILLTPSRLLRTPSSNRSSSRRKRRRPAALVA
jgi:hypothetical protein